MLPLRQIMPLVVCIVLFALSVMVDDCPADSRTWIGPAGGDWFDAGNWNPYGGPDVFDNLSILSGSPQTTTLVYTSNGGGITLDGLSTSASFDQIAIGNEATGSLSISNGGSVSNTISWIGYDVGSNGTVIVGGAGSTWTIATELQVGRWGTGTLQISDGGFVQNTDCLIGDLAGSNGTVTVDGAGSTWSNSNELIIGYESTGSLSISNGGNVSSTTSWIGCEASSNGTVTVDGMGSTWTNATQLQVGRWGTGTLQISNGGFVQSTISWIGDLAGSNGTVTVDGAGSIWINSDQCLNIGYLGTGTLTVSSGGQVSSTDAYIGHSTGSTGTVTVDGTGSLWDTNGGSLCVGGSDTDPGGPGELTINNGGAVNVGNMLKIWNPGTVNLSDGTLTADSINHTDGGTFNFTGGRLNVGTFTGNLVNNGGTLAPGTSPGTTNIQGNYTQVADATMEIEIGGLSAGSQHDQVILTGTADLAGTLGLSLVGGYTPDFYNEFVILTAGTLNGTFDTITGYSVNSGMSLATVYDANSVTIIAAIPGDATLDASVSGADYTIYAANYGQAGNWCDCDFNGDGFVTGADYTIYAANYDSGTIPEPITLTLLGFGVLAMFRRRS